MTARCAVSELPLGQCAGACCNEPKTRPATTPAGVVARPVPARLVMWQDLIDARKPTRPGRLIAKRRGQCASCGELYSAGAEIWADEATGGWIAECCDPDMTGLDAIPGGEGPDGQDLWARLVAKAAGMGEAA